MSPTVGVRPTDIHFFCLTLCFAFAMDAFKMRNLFLGDVGSVSVALCESVKAQVSPATVFLQKCDNDGRLSPRAEDISYP